MTIFQAPVAAPTYVMTPTLNTIKAEFDQISGNSALQNDINVPMVRLRLSTDRNSAIVQKLRLDRMGANGLDSDVKLMKVWRDANSNGVFDAADSTRTGAGLTPNLLSFGNETYSSGTVNITLRQPILVSTVPADYFVTYDISEFAAENAQTGVQIAGPAYFTIQVPNVVVFTTPTFQSNPLVTVKKVISQVTLGVNNVASEIAGITQAQTNVPFLRFNMTTNIALAPWRALRLERGGGSQDPAKPLGRNTDVKFIRIFKDINQDDVLGLEDVDISQVNTSLAVAVAITSVPPFGMVVVSTAGFPTETDGSAIGGRVFVHGAELMTFSAGGCSDPATPTLSRNTGLPCLWITSRGDRLGTSPTPTLDIPVGRSVKKVDVYDQTNDANVQSLITLKNDQFIGPSAQAFFVAYDIGDAAIQNDLVSLVIRDPSWIVMPRGDNVVPTVRTGVTRSNTLGTGTTSYPFVGTNIAINPINLAVAGFTIAPAGAGQGAQNVPILQMTMKVNSDFVNISKVRFAQLGTMDVGVSTKVGDGDFSKVSAWLDNGDKVFTPTTDVLLGSVMVCEGFLGRRGRRQPG